MNSSGGLWTTSANTKSAIKRPNALIDALQPKMGKALTAVEEAKKQSGRFQLLGIVAIYHEGEEYQKKKRDSDHL